MFKRTTNVQQNRVFGWLNVIGIIASEIYNPEYMWGKMSEDVQSCETFPTLKTQKD